jgi:flagellar biogenesis protein FliO
MSISFPVWGFYLIGLIGVIVSVALISWLVMRVERWWTKRQESKYLNGK